MSSDKTPSRTKERQPSYLTQVRAQLAGLVHKYLVEDTHDESRRQAQIAELWQFARNVIVQSYWNGVEAGASGRVKPKTKARQDSRAS